LIVELLRFVFGALWFLLPAGAASTAPVLVRGIPLLDTPVDFGATWRGAPLIGRNKTWRGIVVAPLAGLLVFWLEQLAVGPDTMLRSLVLFGPVPAPVWWGAVIGAGAILGDLAKSFWKRRARVAPGRSWFPFDQIDYAVGALAALAPWTFAGWRVAAGVVAVGLALHIASVAVGRAIGLRERWI
jgi:CDP-2,3-bis-(O-geranylgeranyl)-sn-glycerol synthase